MSVNDNPVMRLHQIVLSTYSANEDSATIDVWRSVFGVPAWDDGRLYLNLHSFISLIQECISYIQHNPFEGNGLFSKKLIGFLNDLYSLISVSSLSLPWGEVKAKMPSNSVDMLLRLLSEALKSNSGQEGDSAKDPKGIDDREIDKIFTGLEALEKDIQATEIPPVLRQFLNQSATSMRTALATYQVRGNEGLVEALKDIQGRFEFLDTDTRTELKLDSRSRGPAFDRLKRLVDDAVELLRSIHYIAKDFTPFLLETAKSFTAS